MRTSLWPILGACLTLGSCAGTSSLQPDATPRNTKTGTASDAVDPGKYHSPDGFFGYAWNTPLKEIPDLKLVPGGAVLAAGYPGKVMDVQIQNCTPGAESAGPCRINQQVQGAGSYVMASYYRDFEPQNPYPGARLAAAIFYFCARTRGDSLSRHVRQRLELCGGEVMFQSRAPKRRQDGHPPTSYGRIVRALTARHGRPDNFAYAGRVIVEDEFGRQAMPREQSYRPLYWCRKSQRALDPSCEATITLEFDSDAGTGRILFATDGVYRFAQALHELSEEKVPLYERLHGYRPDRFKSKRRVCTGTHLCGGGPRQLTAEELTYLDPHSDETER